MVETCCPIEWWQDGKKVKGIDRGGVTVAEISYAEEGKVEGGLGVLTRFMMGSLHPQVRQPPMSPAGWYWQATLTRGVWSRPEKADSIEDAKRAVEAAFTRLDRA